MLNVKTTMTLNGTSKTDAGELIAVMNCNIDANGIISKNTNISNPTLYESNIDVVRADEDEFTAYCRTMEEQFKKEV